MIAICRSPAARVFYNAAGALVLLAALGCTQARGGGMPATPASPASAAEPGTPAASLSPTEEAPGRLQFFVVTASDVVTQPVDTQAPPPQGGPLTPTSVEEAAALAGFLVLEPAYLPQEYTLASTNYYPDSGSVGMLFASPGGRSGSLYLHQQPSPFDPAQREVGPSAAVEKLLINGAPAEFARGAWEDAGSDADVTRWRWDPAAGFGRLLWERDGIFFQISIDEHGDLETARRVASSLGPHFAVRPGGQAPAATALPEATLAVVETELTGPVLHTSIGDFRVARARFVDEANGARPGPGERIVLVILSGAGGERLEPEGLSLEAFANALQELPARGIRLIGDDGSSISTTMNGWVDEEFALGFRVPAAATKFTLFWPGSDMVEITPEE